MNCWEFMKCGNERGMYTCARVPGTLMAGARSITYAAKLADCIRCGFYRSEFYDRGYGRGEGVLRFLRESPHRLPNA